MTVKTLELQPMFFFKQVLHKDIQDDFKDLNICLSRSVSLPVFSLVIFGKCRINDFDTGNTLPFNLSSVHSLTSFFVQFLWSLSWKIPLFRFRNSSYKGIICSRVLTDICGTIIKSYRAFRDTVLITYFHYKIIDFSHPVEKNIVFMLFIY